MAFASSAIAGLFPRRDELVGQSRCPRPAVGTHAWTVRRQVREAASGLSRPQRQRAEPPFFSPHNPRPTICTERNGRRRSAHDDCTTHRRDGFFVIAKVHRERCEPSQILAGRGQVDACVGDEQAQLFQVVRTGKACATRRQDSLQRLFYALLGMEACGGKDASGWPATIR